MPRFLAKTILFGSILIAIIVIGAYEARKAPELDESARTTLRELGMNRSYAIQVETLVGLGDRDLSIEGIYRIDTPNDAYASQSTTTLTIRETGETHRFFLANVSFPDKVYVSVESDSRLLSRTLPLTNGWRSFESTAIPEQFSRIAVHGPILDNALLFSEDTAHLTFLEKKEAGDEVQYTFKLTNPQSRPGGTLETLFERIGESGRVHAWITDGRVFRAVFTGQEYTSTTTFMSLEETIAPPL